MRLLITGSSGLLGLNLALDASRTHHVIGVDRNTLTSVPFELINADLIDPDAVHRIINESKPEAVIHCAALANIDTCEANPDLAYRMNADLPARLADACARRQIRLIHISTDAVFDGQKDGVYIESDTPNPQGVYAQTKFEGERAVLQINPMAIVARVNFYGWSLSGKRSLAEFFINNLSKRQECQRFYGCDLLSDAGQPPRRDSARDAGGRIARAVSRGRAAGHEQVSVWSGDRAQVRVEGKPDFTAIRG